MKIVGRRDMTGGLESLVTESNGKVTRSMPSPTVFMWLRFSCEHSGPMLATAHL